MKLNKLQRQALAFWLGEKIPSIFKDHSVVYSFNSFCDGDIHEWRIIYPFGFAGKIWNSNDTIYVTGASHGEIGKRNYDKQQIIVDKWNEELIELLAMYA